MLITVNVFSQNREDLLNRKISIDAEDGSISHIIATLAKLSECNIVLAMGTDLADKSEPTEEKKITIHLKDVPVEQALSLVVKSIGLSYRLIGDKTFLIGQKKLIEEEIGERSYIIHLNYVDVNKAVDALSILPGTMKAIEGQNAILVRANPETFSEISLRVQEIDVPVHQIEIRARLIEVSISEAEKLGIDWSKMNRLTTILAENPQSTTGAGLPYNYFDDTGLTTHGNLGNPLGELPENQYFQKLDGWSGVGHFSRQLTAFDITIDWLLENNAAKLLTNTHVTALNGEDAEIHIGEIVPFVAEDNDKQIRVERESVGIKLKVKPTVNKDGQITTKIEPEVSSVIELVGGYIPRTKVRRLTSTVTVPNNKRIIVGGLLSSNISTKTNKVPILGDIPFIGKLFRHKYEVVNNTDLIIEITPRIVNINDEEAELEIDPRLERRLLIPSDKEE
jgi:type IV pilus assembly protein PilQ